MVLVMVLMVTPSVFADYDSIFDYIERVDAQYPIVVGKTAPASDSFAVADIVLGVSKEVGVDVMLKIEGGVSENINKILIGHPCDNGLIKLSCEEWPYDPGQAVIRVMDNDLIISGSTPDDTARVGKMLRYYKDFPLLKEEKAVVVYTLSQTMEPLKTDFVCGDGVCEVGEKYECFSDCQRITCFDVCKQSEFTHSACRDLPTDLKATPCPAGEENKGIGYCAREKVCCCLPESEGKNSGLNNLKKQNIPRASESEEEKEQTMARILFLNVGLSVVILFILLIAGSGAYILIKKKNK